MEHYTDKVVVTGAGIEGSTDWGGATRDEGLERGMETNDRGRVHGTRAFLPQLLAGDSGAVVNISSHFGLSGLVGAPQATDCCSAQSAVRTR